MGLDTDPLVEVDSLSVHFRVGQTGFFRPVKQFVHAVDGVSFEIHRGETLGLVGESGSGKTTTGRAILRRVPAASGRIYFKNKDITEMNGKELRTLRRHMQLIFQDPYSSLNPRRTVLDIVAEPLVVHGIVKRPADAVDRVRELLELTGLPADAASRYPHAFSGGQRQRIGIARSLAINPELIVADEPVSALDVSVQAQVVNLLQDLQEQLHLTYLFISHDLAVVRHISNRIAIMYAGKIVEIADSEAIYRTPRHPYTEALLSSVPVPDPKSKRRHRIVLTGEMPNAMTPPPGCRFHTRCPIAESRCATEEPPLQEKAAAHLAACWLR
ncbi:MAG: ABC transporter ATP-binding protein [Acidimicrobiia bacterium]|nr:MAG: ABC transporter ATP-binding protein [Acidimicrobiia bacterium]